MKWFLTCALILLPCLAALAQDKTADEPLPPVEQLLFEHLDEDALEALGIDVARAKQFVIETRKRFEANYVYDLAALREAATEWLPVLEQFEESAPYAAWLKTHLDYFEVAERLQRQARRAADKPASKLPAPSANVTRNAWVEVMEVRPTPPLAFKQVTQLKKIFAAEGAPPELVWLAEVESSFDAKARSPAGAAGLYQLMPATARSLDLSVGFLRDERLHPEKNARAAAKYLRALHKRFGDWRLALAAYNAGESRVAGLLKKHKAKTFDGIANYLPSETQMFVPKVEAVLRKREGRALSELKSPKSGN